MLHEDFPNAEMIEKFIIPQDTSSRFPVTHETFLMAHRIFLILHETYSVQLEDFLMLLCSLCHSPCCMTLSHAPRDNEIDPDQSNQSPLQSLVKSNHLSLMLAISKSKCCLTAVRLNANLTPEAGLCVSLLHNPLPPSRGPDQFPLIQQLVAH